MNQKYQMNKYIECTRACLGQDKIKADSCNKLNVFDWLKNIPKTIISTNLVEVRFKNTRKEIFKNTNNIPLQIGDIVAVETTAGHDVGIVSLTSELVIKQLPKYYAFNTDFSKIEFKIIYRKAKENDIERWKSALNLEKTVMLRTREIVHQMNLKMKISDIEFQGDKTKAIFYYIAEVRVDFRELIKILAEEFKIRIEMRQIGVRQEAGRIGGIASCGRELCCSTWIHNFVSVTTNAARQQDLSLNPNKLAGQCSKLKCCLNYELEIYIKIKKDFPSKLIVLKTKKGSAIYQKTDIFKSIMWYSLEKEGIKKIIPVPVERVKKIIELNKKSILVDNLLENQETEKIKSTSYENTLGEYNLKKKKPKENESKKIVTKHKRIKKLNFKRKKS